MMQMIKMGLLILVTLLVVIVVSSFFFIKLSPQFGASKNDIRTSRVLGSENYENGVFKNAEETTVMMEFKISTLKEYFNKDGKEPSSVIPIKNIPSSDLVEQTDSATRFTWFGHSTVLLEMDGKSIFIDPMLSNTPAPLPFLGPKRFNPNLPISVDSIPKLDAVLISHDHYDHLDFVSIRKLMNKTAMFYVPLGVGAHLRSWGVADDIITELDWWDSTNIDGIKLIAAPARHFSGRGLNDRNSTLWCSFVIKTEKESIYFSGDGGYGNHFKEIGNKYGPFDLCFLECGQYNEQWAQIHMMPEENILANNDLKGKTIVPIHWGAFKLALHSWTDPVERLLTAAKKEDTPVITPVIGEWVKLQQYPGLRNEWWGN